MGRGGRVDASICGGGGSRAPGAAAGRRTPCGTSRARVGRPPPRAHPLPARRGRAPGRGRAGAPGPSPAARRSSAAPAPAGCARWPPRSGRARAAGWSAAATARACRPGVGMGGGVSGVRRLGSNTDRHGPAATPHRARRGVRLGHRLRQGVQVGTELLHAPLLDMIPVAGRQQHHVWERARLPPARAQGGAGAGGA